MLGSHNSSTSTTTMFDSPSFFQKIIMKKSCSTKYNFRPLYTADIVSDAAPWKHAAKYYHHHQQQQPNKKTKKYNLHHAPIPPTLSPSISSSTAASSLLSDSAIMVPSCSTPTVRQKSSLRSSSNKRPLSSEILIKIMDQRLLKKKQQQQQQEMMMINNNLPQLYRSVSSSTTMSQSTNSHTANTTRLNKLMLPNKPSNCITTDSGTMRRGSNRVITRQQNNNNKTKKTNIVLNKLNQNNTATLITEWPYVLTQDNDEQDRLVAQHYLLRTAFGSDFTSPIKPLLQKGIVVLDVGCGNGTWTMEMSTAFPKSTFIGMDQVAFFPKDIKPRNCYFRTCAVGGVLPFPDNSIDYIYQRDMNWGLTGHAWQPLLKEYQRILKPGGWIEFVEPDLETQNSLENECSMNDKLISGLSMRQQDPYLVHRLPTMLSINGFKHVLDSSQSFPLGWGSSHSTSSSSSSGASTTATDSSILEEDEDEVVINESYTSSATTATALKQQQTNSSSTTTKQSHCSEFARAMSSQYLFLLKSLRPWLSTVMHVNYEKYDEYIAGLPTEWSRARTYINWHCIIAQKPLHSS